MGGRTKRDRPERENWIEEVSTDRIDRYLSMLDSGGAVQRLDGSARIHGQRQYFRGLLESEKARRSGQ